MNAGRLRHLWIVANGMGIAGFLAVASESWIEPELAKVPGASGGDAFVWAVTALPLLMLFSIANLGWLAAAILGRSLYRSWRPAVFPSLAMAAWVVACIYDNAHHGI